MATINRDPWKRMTNLKEVVENKMFLTELGWVDNKPYFRGRFYSESEIAEMFPTTFKYRTVQLDSNQVTP